MPKEKIDIQWYLEAGVSETHYFFFRSLSPGCKLLIRKKLREHVSSMLDNIKQGKEF